MFTSLTSMLNLILPVAGCMMLFYGIYQVVAESRATGNNRIQERLRGIQAKKNEERGPITRKRSALSGEKGFADVLLGRLSFIPRIQTMLDQADVDWSASSLMLYLFAGAMGVTCVLVVLKFSLVAAIGCGLAVIFLPLAWLSFMRKRRIKKLTNQLPDVFEMMSQALRAGHSLASAIQLVAEQLPNPIASEFARVYQEQNLGLKIEDALLSMAQRLDQMDVKFFVTAVLIQRQTGGDLAEVIDNIGSVIRSRIELFGMVSALTAEGRLSGWVLFALPFVVFAASKVVNPDYANVLLTDPTGKILLMVAAGMQLMGLAMIRWIVNIKV